MASSRTLSTMQSSRLELLIVGIAILAIAAASLFTYWNIIEDRDVTRETLFKVGDSIAASIEEHLNETLRDAHNAAYSAVVLIENSGGLGSHDAAYWHRELNREMVDNTSITRLIAADASGRIVATSAENHVPALSIADLDYFRWHQAHPAESGPRRGQVAISPIDARRVIPYSFAIHDERGKLIGILVAEISVDHMIQYYATLTRKFPADIVLLDREGIRLARFPDLEGMVGKRVIQDFPLDVVFQANGSMEYTRSDNGLSILYSYHILKPQSLAVLVGFDAKSAMAGWEQRSRQRVAVVGAGSVVFFAMVGLFVMYLRKLQQSEERLRKRQAEIESLFRGAPVGIAEIANREFIIVNERLCQMTGYAAEEMIGKSTLMLYLSDQEWEETGESMYARVMEEGVASTETRFRHKDGSVIDVLISVALIVPGNPRAGATVTAIDITENKAMMVKLENAYERMKVLSGMLINAQEIERRKISGELHDEIGQALTAVKLNLHNLGKRMAGGTALAEDVESCLEITDLALTQVRDLSVNLRPPQLDLMGLPAALEWLLKRQEKPAGLDVHFTTGLRSNGRTPQADITCFRLVQEALTNVLKHAHAKNLWVEVNEDEREIELYIRDDGVGFDPDAARMRASRGGSVGLLSMEERVAVQDGSFELESRPGAGTLIRAHIPLGSRSAGPQLAAEGAH